MKSAVCLIVRNEARDIAEWIAFHALVGFDTQIIFDNRSDDGTDAIVKSAAELHDIRYHAWADTGPRSQVGAYEAACAAYKLEFDWIAFVDSDEFLIPAADEPVNRLLARYEGFTGIAINWAVYGANGHDDFPDGLVLESFTRRANTDFFPARHVKSIVRPGFVARCLNPHCFDLSGDRLGSYCNPQGQTMQWWPAPELGGILPGVSLATPDYSVWRVNHYFTRSRAHWAAKLARGYPSDVAIRRMADFAEYDRNEMEDGLAERYLPALRSGVAALRARVPVSGSPTGWG
jgi:glycosyltransferase involved in cell wall biosynthesis